ncbi:activating signal cointegrator 1 complex subunit 1 [Bombyx mandarina]|uniref:Activating signal cointegrator 1 complex subunit 1 n=1 Tax=Bombyx mandarina TaxID=7092 RepID=A0A6J2K6V7_BOMMA|nr:activating signal cointegrator 1 complex subunit 1 [Bombyx mandarina]
MLRNLKPEVVWIEGRCYRANDSPAEFNSMQEHDLYENEITFEEPDDEEDDFKVEMLDNSRYCTSFHVSKHYLGSIIGKKGAIISGIKRDTKTDIKIPKHDQTGDVVILGPAESNVKAARRRINMIIMSSRMKQTSTHFLSIPMNNADIVKEFEKFKERVLQECPNPTLEESLFIRSHKLHLTLGVMSLMDNDERIQVTNLLTEARDTIVIPLLQGHVPLKIRLKGLSYMNDDPKAINVLYGRVQEEDWAAAGLIQKLGDALVDHFYKAGFMKKEFGRENIKLHVTFINTKYRETTDVDAPQQNQTINNRKTFDGSEILEKFADYDFGVMEVTEIHLSQRHTMGPDGYYQPTCIISCKI